MPTPMNPEDETSARPRRLTQRGTRRAHHAAQARGLEDRRRPALQLPLRRPGPGPQLRQVNATSASTSATSAAGCSGWRSGWAFGSNEAVLVLTVAAALVLELPNTAIESVVDLAIGRRFAPPGENRQRLPVPPPRCWWPRSASWVIALLPLAPSPAHSTRPLSDAPGHR